MDTDLTDVSLPPSVSPVQLAARLGRAGMPLIIDVRKGTAFAAAERVIAGAVRVAPELLPSVLASLPREREVVAYCVHGHEVSQGAARVLRAAGFQAAYLEGGITAWEEARLPAMLKVSAPLLPAGPDAGNAPAAAATPCPEVDRK
jgi:rhodanese-related sulfurtransferase